MIFFAFSDSIYIVLSTNELSYYVTDENFQGDAMSQTENKYTGISTISTILLSYHTCKILFSEKQKRLRVQHKICLGGTQSHLDKKHFPNCLDDFWQDIWNENLRPYPSNVIHQTQQIKKQPALIKTEVSGDLTLVNQSMSNSWPVKSIQYQYSLLLSSEVFYISPLI